jgi:DNA-binding transcriptional LysR family regulator
MVQSIPTSSLVVFERAAHHMRFAAAAADLGITPTAVSKAIAQLEADLGVRLFQRTTRRVALTEAGTRLVAQVAPSLAQLRTAIDAARDASERPAGKVRISTSFVAYRLLFEPYLPKLFATYPEISLELSIDSSPTDIVGRRFDAGVRLGRALQRDMVGVALGAVQQLVVVGAPHYLARHGRPKRLDDLLAHACIRQRLSTGARLLEWTLLAQGKPLTLDVQGPLVVDEMRAALAAACQGIGLAYVFEAFARADFQTGALERVLPKYALPREAFYLYYPSRQMPAKLRAVVDFFRAANALRR